MCCVCIHVYMCACVYVCVCVCVCVNEFRFVISFLHVKGTVMTMKTSEYLIQLKNNSLHIASSFPHPPPSPSLPPPYPEVLVECMSSR